MHIEFPLCRLLTSIHKLGIIKTILSAAVLDLLSCKQCFSGGIAMATGCTEVALIGDQKLLNPLKVLKHEVTSSQTADA